MLPEAEDRVAATRGALHDHRDPPPAHLAQLALREPDELAPVERDAAGDARARASARAPAIASAVIDLPEPLSPRRRRPAMTEVESGTADDPRAERHRRGHASRASGPPVWIEHGAQAVAEQVEREGGDQDRGARERDEPPVRREVRVALADHQPPLGRRVLGAEPEERERRGREQDAAGVDARSALAPGRRVGQHVAEQDPRAADSPSARQLSMYGQTAMRGRLRRGRGACTTATR